MSSFEIAIPTILKHEGGYVNHPNDDGGPTKYGISLRFLAGLDDNFDQDGDGDLDADDIRKLTVEAATAVYKKYWWDKYKYDRILHQTCATKIFDMAVNMGAGRAHRLVQETLNFSFLQQLTVDGVLGPKTIQCINNTDGERLFHALCAACERFYKALFYKNPAKYAPFIEGWMNRARSRF